MPRPLLYLLKGVILPSIAALLPLNWVRALAGEPG